MSATLTLSANTHTAVINLLNRLNELRSTEPLKPVGLLLPTLDVIQDLQAQLGDCMGVSLYQFYLLGSAILDEARTPIHAIDDTAVRRLIRRILAELNAEGRLTSFAPVWEKPGFGEVILDWVREMKSQGIFPEQYQAFARETGTQRDQQLAALYTRYQSFLQQRNYSDPDGLLWLAAEALEKEPDLFRRYRAMYVLGFDQFTPVQIQILKHLAQRTVDFKIYLLWDENRSADSLPLARLHRTREALAAEIPMDVEQIPEEIAASSRLSHLQRGIFESSVAQSTDHQQLRLIEAPSRESEVRAAVVEVKRLLLDQVPPGEIAILAPNQITYLPMIRTIAAEYGVPIECEQDLLENPVVIALLNLLALPPEFPWQLTFETLRSPYIRQSWLSAEQIVILDKLSRERPVIAGRDQWAFAVQPLVMELTETEEEDLGEPPLVATLDPEVLFEIEQGMTAFFDHLTPPENASYAEFTWWLQTAVLGCYPESENQDDQPVEREPTLDMLDCCRESTFSQRDLQALALVLRSLRRLLSSAEIILGDAQVPWGTFRDELINLLRVQPISNDTLQSMVRFDRLEAGRARTIEYLFVLGLSEGEFPTAPSPDSLYSPREREIHPLPLFRYTPADDASLWWQVIGNTNQKLFLLRPYIDENGALWQASPYWEAVMACFSGLRPERIPIAAQSGWDQAASLNELLIALAQSGAKTVPIELSGLWMDVQFADWMMNQRQSYAPPGEFEGMMTAEPIRTELAERYAERHVWSASRLNRYSNCPYGFFAEQVLKLEAQQEPEEGMNVLQRGSLLHAILERLYQLLRDQAIAPTTANRDLILELLEESCAQVFKSAPQRYGFRPGSLWEYEQQELFRLLHALITWECENNQAEARFLPYLLEAGFGIGTGLPPLEVETETEHFRLRGLIDRVDRDSAGNLRIVDYKSGSSRWSSSDLQKGLAFQTALYALAAERFLLEGSGRVAESDYWHIPSRVKSGSLKFQGNVREDELAETVIQQAARNIALVRAGVFPSAPGKPVQGSLQCSSQCDFGRICRVTRQSIAKARRAGLA